MKSKKKFNNRWLAFFWLLVLGLVIRIILSPFGTLQLDHNTFVAWSNIVAEKGFIHFYDGWSDYLPGYVYVLWLLGTLHKLFPILSTEWLYKLPAILFDIATAILIFKIVARIKSSRSAMLVSAIYLFNPAVLANSTLWGQIDAIPSFFALASIYLAQINPLLSAVCLAIGTLIKPQAALAGFVILYLAYKNKWRVARLFSYGGVGMAVFLGGFLPFYKGGQFIQFVFDRLNTTLSQYTYTSVNAFNIWGLGGFWKPDTWQNIVGLAITSIVSLVAAWRLRKVKNGEYLLAALVFLVGFLFMTRLHERHLLVVFAPLAAALALYPGLIFSYLILSFVYVTNLYYAYIWISQDFTTVFSGAEIDFLIILNLLAFVNAVVIAWKTNDNLWKNIFQKLSSLRIKEKVVTLPDKVSPRIGKILLSGILLFAFITRIANLSFPANEYFDEVYHAFTARVMLHGDQKAWEWWNPNPEGFAYEWTHPPIAKEAMVVGMQLFGENSFGWRIPAVVFGMGCVLLLYLISMKLFNSRDIALLTAALFSLEGLPLVMSRIGMNDIYFLFFMLLAFYLFLTDKYFISSIMLGLAAASKWSTLWFLPFLVVAHFALRKKFTVRYIWYFVLPPLIYLATYIPFFTSGHTFDQFFNIQTFIQCFGKKDCSLPYGLQQQMWQYHTTLVATHAYSSSWWTWPLDLRPVWLYVNRDIQGTISNIYAFGNPILLWGGVVSFFVSAYWAIKERNKKLGLMLFGYSIFFASWAASPRIMFFYHFLPSIPFMVLFMGYSLKRLGKVSLPFLLIVLIAFAYFYPHWTGGFVSEQLDNSYYWLESWR